MKFKCYEIWHKRKYCIFIPEDISQLWVIHYLLNTGAFDFEIDIVANRQGFEAICNACALLSKENNIIVYFPCKRNKSTNRYFSIESKSYEFIDLVFMKPDSLKISDWKEIRNCVLNVKAKEQEYDFTDNFRQDLKYKHIEEKYKYRKKIIKEEVCFDTAFFNFPWHEYIAFKSFMEKFLNPNMEEHFFEAMTNDSLWKVSNEYRYVSKCYYGTREIGGVFWDNDIFQKVEEQRKRMESNCEDIIS